MSFEAAFIDELEKVAAQHIFVTGHSGAGKSTKAHELSAQMNLPVHSTDDDPDIENFYENKLKPLAKKLRASGRKDALYAASKQLSSQYRTAARKAMQRVKALKQPHIVEGTVLAVHNELLPKGANLVLVDPPKKVILQQRIARSMARKESAGKVPDLKHIKQISSDLWRYNEPGIRKLRNRK